MNCYEYRMWRLGFSHKRAKRICREYLHNSGPIAVALAIDGEPIPTSRAIVTPAAVDDYFNVTSTAIITVPRGCCWNVSVENVSTSATAAVPAPAINVQNANLTVTRTA